MAEGEHCQDNDAAPLTNSNIRLPAETCRLNAKITCATPLTSRLMPKRTEATISDFPGHTRMRTPRTTASSPDISVDFHKCCNSFGGALLVIVGVFHGRNRAGTRSHYSAASSIRHDSRKQRRRGSIQRGRPPLAV